VRLGRRASEFPARTLKLAKELEGGRQIYLPRSAITILTHESVMHSPDFITRTFTGADDSVWDTVITPRRLQTAAEWHRRRLVPGGYCGCESRRRSKFVRYLRRRAQRRAPLSGSMPTTRLRVNNPSYSPFFAARGADMLAPEFSPPALRESDLGGFSAIRFTRRDLVVTC
jgi:hypothetical protein